MEPHIRLTLLLLAAIAVAITARKLRLPYTVGLVAAGTALAFAHLPAGPVLTHDLIYDIALPPLLFEAALNLHWQEMRADLAPILALSVLGVVISAAVVAGGCHLALGWAWPQACVFGVLIAATDPVAVIALFKDLGLTGRLRCLVESESLFNDGVAACLFSLTLAWASTGALPVPFAGVWHFVLVAGGGTLVGLLAGGAAIALAGRATDQLVETAITLLAAYGSFQLAEAAQLSGVLATVAAGLVMGNAGLLRADDSSPVSVAGRAAALSVWEFIAFLANSLVFLLIGLAVAGLQVAALGLLGAGTIIGLVLLGRAATVYPVCLLFGRGGQRIGLGEQHVLWWGGLRGALGLALALALPESLAGRDMIVLASFVVVVFSVMVQGLTMPVLLGWLEPKD